MNSKRIVLGIGIVLAVLVAFTAPVAADAEVWFSNPDDPNGPGEPLNAKVAPGENVTIQIMWHVNATESGAKLFQVGVDFDRSVVNITNVTNPIKVPGSGPYPPIYWWDDVHQYRYYDDGTAPLGAYVWLIGANDDCHEAPITVPIANLTIEGVSGGTTALNFTHEIRHDPTVALSQLFDCAGDLVLDDIWYNSEIECTGPTETFEKELVEGWNLVSLPLTASDMTVGSVLSSISGSYDAVMRYDTSAPGFAVVADTDEMENGLGYFINITDAAGATWSYEGSAYNSMNVGLSTGLNCIGWINETGSALPDLLDGSIAGNYSYVARWNTTSPGYEVFVAGAPSEFIDFSEMSRGNGYWIVAKENCTLEVS